MKFYRHKGFPRVVYSISKSQSVWGYSCDRDMGSRFRPMITDQSWFDRHTKEIDANTFNKLLGYSLRQYRVNTSLKNKLIGKF